MDDKVCAENSQWRKGGRRFLLGKVEEHQDISLHENNTANMSTILENAKKHLPKFEDHHKESEHGIVYAISGPVVTAEKMPGAQMYEIVRVGNDRYLGEIIQIRGETAKIQLFEDTSGLRPGDPVLRTHHPLTVELGPGCMNTVFDGVQKPLQHIAETSGSFFLPKGYNLPPLDLDKLWYFEPTLKVGDHVEAGDIFGKVQETELVTHFVMVPPKDKGTITLIAPAGEYTVKEFVIELEFQGKTKSFSMVHSWPVRQPRPVVERLPCDTPLITGTRVFDSLFPAMQGATCAIPGSQGGKHTVLQTLMKFANCACVVYVGCSERANEMAEALMSFPCLVYPDRKVPVMHRSCVLANVDNMAPAVRDASIFTGISIAEYYRDMGLNVVLTADNTTHWADALREIDSNLGTAAPTNNGYPAFLASRLASFYERAGKVSCVGTPTRTGSISIFATVNPVIDDWTSDPIVKPTMDEVQAFWALDKRLAQRKHFPSVNWFYSFSNYKKNLQGYYDELDPLYVAARTTVEQVLAASDELGEIVQLVGKDSMPLSDRVTIETGRIIREDFLQQNVFSSYDKFCPLYKTIGMTKNFATFYDLAQRAVSNNKKLTWENFRPLEYDLLSMKFMDPADGQDKITQDMKALNEKIRKVLRELEEQ